MDSKSDEFEKWVAEYQPPNQDALINDLAIRSFREIGDGDYIAARMALRARLPSQYRWAALQAIEKYLKCILLLNRVKAKDVGHKITLALEKVNGIPQFDIRLPPNEREVFNHIASSEGDRYLVMSLALFAHELSALDSLVWRLRQYCEPLNVEHYNDSPNPDVLASNLTRIEKNLNDDPSAGYLKHGFLEKVLAEGNHPAREALVWKNAMYGGNEPLVARDALSGLMAINSPLYLHPEIVTVIDKFIKLPSGALKEFEALAGTKAP